MFQRYYNEIKIYPSATPLFLTKYYRLIPETFVFSSHSIKIGRAHV